MKKSITGFLTYLTKRELQQLVSIVDETIAPVYSQEAPPSKTFSAADLWNIQRSKRSFVQRRYIL